MQPGQKKQLLNVSSSFVFDSIATHCLTKLSKLGKSISKYLGSQMKILNTTLLF